ncbi:alpha/beta fold hydrolase [Micromonospora sp. NPDC049171]|uniref:alpha/beta fold hydrolase n=1 Tax=Micromonospora sp. NPDC049171 TaxID=3155770 RepID=UPI0033D838CD
MRFTSETIANGVSERRFTLGDIPGVLWSPGGAASGRPLVLLAHGGGNHKLVSGLVARAHRFVTAHGFAVAAVDAPGHGDRSGTELTERFRAGIRERIAAGEPIDSQLLRHSAQLGRQAVSEWRTVLDALQQLDVVGRGGPVGFWGLSLGSAIGVPLVAARITVPVEFLLQWDDKLVPRDSAVALFDAFASPEKTLHANAGPHTGVPAFERESSERFLARHLAYGGNRP